MKPRKLVQKGLAPISTGKRRVTGEKQPPIAALLRPKTVIKTGPKHGKHH